MKPTLIKMNDAKVRKGDNIDIYNYLTKDTNKSFSFSVAILDGKHPRTLSEICDRAYYVLEGNAVVTVGENSFNVEVGDVIIIPKSTIHSINGKLKYVIVNSPSFDAAYEKPQ